MLIGILVVIWIAVFAAIIVGRLRDRSTDRSIDSFHERMERLGNPTPFVEPAHRLNQTDETPPREPFEDEIHPPTLAPRLRIVQPNASVAQLERELSWEEWSAAYADDPVERSRITARLQEETNPRAAAYRRAPSVTTMPAPTATPAYGTRRQRLRRRNILATLAVGVVIMSATAVLVSSVIVDALAVVAWVTLIGYLGLLYYAVTSGLINSSTVASAPRVRRAATTREYDDRSAQGSYWEREEQPVRRAAVSSLAEDTDERLEQRQNYVRRPAPRTLYEEPDERYYAQAL